MAKRRDIPLRKLTPEEHDRNDEYWVWVQTLTHAQRIELVFEATRRAVAMQGEDWDSWKLDRSIGFVVKRAEGEGES